jgi:hypothetical protein
LYSLGSFIGGFGLSRPDEIRHVTPAQRRTAGKALMGIAACIGVAIFLAQRFL